MNLFSQTVDASKLLQTHITGVLVHGRKTLMLLDLMQWPHDSNLALNSVLYAISSEVSDGQLPPTLYIQMDNCARENKNKYFIGMMALLVKLGFVKDIFLSFLMVGHIHEGLFSNSNKILFQV